MKLEKIDQFNYLDKVITVYEDIYKEKFLQKVTNINQYQVLKNISSIENDYLVDLTLFFNKKQYTINYLEIFYPSKTLDCHIKNKTNFTKQEATNIIKQLLLALEALHNHDIIHGHLSPHNILILHDYQVKLTGLNRCFYKNTPLIIEEPDTFFAPEKYGYNVIDFSFDIYSFGSIITEFLKYCCPELLLELSPVIEKCIAVDTINRYQECNLILLAFDSFNGFLPLQIAQIEKCKALGLTLEQIQSIAKPYFNSKQIGVLKHALHENIDSKVITLMNDSKFNSRQMFQIKQGSINGLTVQQISLYSKPYYSENEMAIFRTGLINQLTYDMILKNIKFYSLITDSNKYDDNQLKVIRYAFFIGLHIEDIQVICFNHLTNLQMSEILSVLEKKK